MQQVLGQITCPTGQLVVLDCGLLAHWDHAAHGPQARQLQASGGQFEFNGVKAVTIGGLAPGPHQVSGAPTPDGAAWRWVDVIVQLGVPPARAEVIGEVFVDAARLILADLTAIEAWNQGQSSDGNADVVFWGRDAAAAAAAGNIPALDSAQWGWTDIPDPDAQSWCRWLEEQKQAQGWKMMVDYRPHDHHYAVMALVRASPVEAGHISIGDAGCLVFMTRRGDGVFPVWALRDATGALTALRIDLARDGGAGQVGGPGEAALPPDPMASAQDAVSSAAKGVVQQTVERAAKRTMWRTVRRFLPRWAWPLLPDGKTGFKERALKLGKQKLIGFLVGCAFTGCLLSIVFGGIAAIIVYAVVLALRGM